MNRGIKIIKKSSINGVNEIYAEPNGKNVNEVITRTNPGLIAKLNGTPYPHPISPGPGGHLALDKSDIVGTFIAANIITDKIIEIIKN